MKPDKIKVGDTVLWRPNWGKSPAQPAKIAAIELCERERDKYGIPVNEVYANLKDRCCFDLENGSWSYGYQIDPIEQPQEAR